jgi:predicted RNase H-like HicB family nuclease
MKVVIQAQFELFGVLKRKNGWHIAHCPPLDITTQGRTENEAKRNLIEAAELFVTSCFERGTFEQALRELGWRVVAGRAVSRAGKPRKQTLKQRSTLQAREFSFPVPFGLEKAAECPV